MPTTTLRIRRLLAPSLALSLVRSLALGLAVISGSALAMTPTQASSNLMYFAFAMKEGERCEAMGFTGMEVLQRWEARNGDVLVQSLRRLEVHLMQSRKLAADDAREVAIGLFALHKASFDREIAPGHTVKSCMRFGETLRLYEDKLVRP